MGEQMMFLARTDGDLGVLNFGCCELSCVVLLGSHVRLLSYLSNCALPVLLTPNELCVCVSCLVTCARLVLSL